MLISAIMMFAIAGGLTATPAEQVPALQCAVSSIDFPRIRIHIKLIADDDFEPAPNMFSIMENGSCVENLSVQPRQSRQYLVFLLDRSSSIEPSVNGIKESACGFINSLSQEANIAILSFASDVEINQKFTKDRQSLVKAVKSIRPWGGTSLYDALYLACETLYADSEPQDMRILVLFTDGKDETPALRTQMSIKSLDEVLKKAKRDAIRIITIGMGNEIDEQVLTRCASETSGWFLFAPTADKLSELYSEIVHRLNREHHITISYHAVSPEFDTLERKVKITCNTGKESLSVTTIYVPPPKPVRKMPVLQEPQTRIVPVVKPATTPSGFVPKIIDRSLGGANADSQHPGQGIDIGFPELPEP